MAVRQKPRPPEPQRLAIIEAEEARLNYKPPIRRLHISNRWRKVKPKKDKADFWMDDIVEFKAEELRASILRSFSTSEDEIKLYQLRTPNGAVFSAYGGELTLIKHTRQTKYKFERKVRAKPERKTLKLRFRPLFGLVPKAAEEISESNRALPPRHQETVRGGIDRVAAPVQGRPSRKRKGAKYIRPSRSRHTARSGQGNTTRSARKRLTRPKARTKK